MGPHSHNTHPRRLAANVRRGPCVDRGLPRNIRYFAMRSHGCTFFRQLATYAGGNPPFWNEVVLSGDSHHADYLLRAGGLASDQRDFIRHADDAS